MTPEELVLMIGVLCRVHYSNGLIPTETKIECIEKYANCAIGLNGKIDRKRFKECKKQIGDGTVKQEDTK